MTDSLRDRFTVRTKIHRIEGFMKDAKISFNPYKILTS